MVGQPRSYSFDIEQLLQDGVAAITADGACQVSGAAKILDLGSATANYSGIVIIDVQAIDIANSDEEYFLLVQGSNSATFASGVQNLACLPLADTAVAKGGAIDATVGRYELPFVNRQDDTIYQYIRMYVDVEGTSPSIDFTAFIGQASGGIMP